MTTVYDALEKSYRVRLRRRYWIVAPRKRASYCVALTCTYHTGNSISKKTLPALRRRLEFVRRLWLKRLWELGKHDLWLYQRGLSADPHDLDPSKLLRAFKLHADCRPRCVAYMPPPDRLKNIQHKPCRRSNFCPHCWAALAARQTQYVKKIVNEYIAAKPDARLTVTTQVSEYFFSSRGIGGIEFSTMEDRRDAILRLRQQIDRCKSYLNSSRVSVWRKTIAMAWRIVVEPADTGWRIQLRQLSLTTEKQTPPTSKPPWMRNVFRRSADVRSGFSWRQRKTTLTMDGDVYDRLMEFNDYPMGWLTNDIELTAIYLNATAATNLLGGGGKLRRVGDALLREFVLRERELKNATAARRA